MGFTYVMHLAHMILFSYELELDMEESESQEI